MGKRPGTAPQFCGLKFMNTKAILFRSPMLGSGIRGFDGEALGGRRLARTPPRRVTPWLAASTIAPQAPEAIAVLSSAGDDSRPHHFFKPQNRGVVIQALPAAS